MQTIETKKRFISTPPGQRRSWWSRTNERILQRYRNSQPQLRLELAIVIEQALAVAAEPLQHHPASEVTAAELGQRVGNIQLGAAKVAARALAQRGPEIQAAL